MNASRKLPTHRLIGLALVLLTTVVFIQALGFGFVGFDDDKYVVNNPHIREGLTARNISWVFSTMYFSNWHPLTWCSYLLDYEIFGLSPWGYHLTNLLFHIANVWLLFVVLVEMTGSLSRSALVVALFAVHPLHVESVAWISERKGVLSTFFGILAIMAYLRYVRRPCVRRYLAVMTALALGLMAKPMLVSWPALLLLLDYWPLGRLVPRKGETGWKTCVKEKLPLAAIAAAACLLTWLAQEKVGSTRMLEGLSFGYRAANALVAFQQYIVMTFLPTGLACLYPYRMDLSAGEIVLAGLLLAGVSVLVVLPRERRRYLVVGWLWFLISLLPVIGLIQVGVQAMADRYTYVPLIGVFIMIAWGLPCLLRRYVFRSMKPMGQAQFLRIGSIVVVGVLAVGAWLQTRYWSNSEALFQHAIRVTAENDFAHYNLGTVYRERGRLTETAAQYREAIRINPKHADAWNNLGEVLVQEGRPAEALSCLRKAVVIRPDHAKAWCNLGACLGSLGQMQASCQALERAVRIRPIFPEAWRNLAVTLERMGRLDEARQASLRAEQGRNE